MHRRHWISRLFFVCLTAMACSVFAKDVSKEDILLAAKNWINANTAFWGDDAIGEPQDAQKIANGDEALPLWAVNLSPAGYIVFSADDTLPPVVAFSTKGDFSQAPNTLSLMVSRQGEIYQDALSKEKTRGDAIAAENLESWNTLLSRTRASSITPTSITRAPMLNTEWSQDTPFNKLCPPADGSSANAVTGCVAVAVSQVMKYHEWPVAGVGIKKNIDNRGDLQATIQADYSFPYNWSAIADEYDGTEPTSDIIPLARLLLDAGTLGEANYEVDTTSTFSSDLNVLLPQYLNYSSSIKYGDSRSGYVGHTPQSTIYSRIKDDMTEGRPAILSFIGHAFVADGLGTSGGKDYYHFNYGWGGLENGWYLLEDGTEILGYKTIVITATTNILPKAVAAFKPLSVEQKSSFTLSWDFPKRITAQAFRLSKTEGTRATTVISDSISGTARSYNLTDQSGTNTYTLEAKVNDEWQPASEGVTITVKTSPAALPTMTMPDELTSVAGAQASMTVTSSTTLKSLTVTSSRPDILPSSGISITGSGASRTVKLTPSGDTYGNVLLYVTAMDNAGNVVKRTSMLSTMANEALVWHTTFAEAKEAATGGKYILMVAGSNTCSNTNYFRNTVCETSDIKANLLANYSLWYCNVDTSTDNYWPYVTGGGGNLPFVGIIDTADLSASQRYHGGFMDIEEGREFLDTKSPYFSLDDSEIYALGTIETLEISVLDSGATIRYRKNATTPTTSDTLYSGSISLSATTTITARAFKNDQPIGTPVTKIYTFLEQVATPVLSQPKIAYFSGSCVVTATCATPGATIRYTTNGYFPDSYDEIFPAGGLTVTEETILLVRAFKDGMKESEWSVSELYELKSLPAAASIATGDGISFYYSSEPWFLQTTTYNSKPSAMQSGAITDDGITTMVAKVTGPGSLSFYWKASTEYRYDTLSFSIDGKTLEVISGDTSWIQVTCDVTGSGDHYLYWAYEKDYMDYDYSDCAWVDDIVWTPSDTPEPEPEPEPEDNIFEYEIVDGKVHIIGLKDDYYDVAEIVIPTEIEGLPVTQINDYAFESNDNLTSATISASVQTIEEGAFWNCQNLESVILQEGVASFGDEAFSDCTSLTTITLPASLTDMGPWVFDHCSALTEIKVTSANPSYTSVNGVLFSKDKKQLIYYPAGRQGLSYEIPATVTDINPWAFNGCVNLSEFKVASENTTYTSVNGVLFSKDKKRLIAYPSSNAATQYEVPTTVTEICQEAFDGSANLTAISVPDSVTEIGQWAFCRCYDLEAITLSSNLTELRKGVFSYCSSLLQLVIPDSVTTIGYGIFGWSSSPITELVIGDGVEEIDEYAFDVCDNLEKVYTDNEYVINWFAEYMPDVEILSNGGGDVEPYDTVVDGIIYHIEDGEATVKGLKSKTLRDVIIKPKIDGAKVTAIGDEAFMDCGYALSVSIPEGVTAIGDFAFCDCYSLQSVSLPSTLREIGTCAFRWCSLLSSITIPEGVTIMGEHAIGGCQRLQSAVLPSTLTAIPESLFEGCWSLATVTIPEGVTKIGSRAFCNCWHSLQEVKLPATLEAIDDLAFDMCTSLSGIVVPEGVTTIGECAFSSCTSLKSVILPGTLTEIREGAFGGCESLESIAIPNGVTSIGHGAFSGCFSLKSMEFPSTLMEISDAFYDCSNLEAFSVDEGNEYFASRDGVLYTNDFSELLVYPPGKKDESFTLPKSVRTIDRTDNSHLMDINVEDGSTSFAAKDGVLYNSDFTVLEWYPPGRQDAVAEIPDGVTAVSKTAFSGCGDTIKALVIGNDLSYISFWDLPYDVRNNLVYVQTDNEPIAAWLEPSKIKVFSKGEVPPRLPYDTVVDGIVYNVNLIAEKATAVSVKDESLKVIVIQSEVDGMPVTDIQSTSFASCNSLTSVTIPGSVSSLGCLNFCYNLKDVTLKEGIKEIWYAFSDCYSLTSITIPASVNSISPWAFYHCVNLTAIEVAEGNETYASKDGVLYTKDLSELVIYPPGRKEETFTVPATVRSISPYAIDNRNLRSFKVEGGSEFFTARDGVLYSADMTRLVRYPQGRMATVLEIPDGVLEIDEYAFVNCDKQPFLFGLVIGKDLQLDPDTSSFEGLSYISYVQTDNEMAAQWGRNCFGTAIGMDETPPTARIVTENGLSYRVTDTYACLISVSDENTEAVILNSIDGVPVRSDYNAFTCLLNLEFVRIPANYLWIPSFYGCENLRSVFVDEGNKYYASRNGVVYNKDFTKLEFYPPARLVSDCKLQPGWNLITPTLVLDEDSVAALLDVNPMVLDTALKTYRRAHTADITPGTALWIFSKENQNLTLRGERPDAWTPVEYQGWNLIGAVDDIEEVEWNKYIEAALEWNGHEFREVDFLEKGRGYWVLGK